MEENNANVELYEEDSIIELFDDSGKGVKFYEIATIALEGKLYELLQPAEPVEGIGEDEAVIFEYTEDEENDERNFMPLADEVILEKVFNEYLKAVSDCDCCCDDDCDCEHEHGHEHNHEHDGCGCGCGHDHKKK